MSRVYNYAFGSGSLLGPEPNPLNLNLWSGSKFSDFLDRTEGSGLSSSKSSKNWTDLDHSITIVQAEKKLFVVQASLGHTTRG